MDDIDVSDRRQANEVTILNSDTLDPKFHYRFVQSRPTQIARAKLKGYRVVNPAETKEETMLGQEDGTPENIIQHGDRILMRVPKARHEALRAQVKKRAQSRLLTPEQRVRDMAKDRGVKLDETDDKEDDE